MNFKIKSRPEPVFSSTISFFIQSPTLSSSPHACRYRFTKRAHRLQKRAAQTYHIAGKRFPPQLPHIYICMRMYVEDLDSSPSQKKKDNTWKFHPYSLWTIKAAAAYLWPFLGPAIPKRRMSKRSLMWYRAGMQFKSIFCYVQWDPAMMDWN